MKKNTLFHAIRLTFLIAILAVAHFSWAAIGDQFAKVEILQPDKIQSGRVAFVDASIAKLIEVDLSGKITWEYSIPRVVLGNGKLTGGTDVEWLPMSDSFLLAIPGSGVFEISRQGQVVWKYLTPYADHDADRLENGNTVFVHGWDDDDAPIMTDVDVAGKITYQLFARDLNLNLDERHQVTAEPYSNTHANSVRKLGPNEYLLSLRNFNQFVKIFNGKVVEKVKNARHVHDPVPYKDGYLLAVHLQDDRSALLFHSGAGQRLPFFKPEPGTWVRMRTVELLQNGNILISGAREIGQLDSQGQLVWTLTADQFSAKNPARELDYFSTKPHLFSNNTLPTALDGLGAGARFWPEESPPPRP